MVLWLDLEAVIVEPWADAQAASLRHMGSTLPFRVAAGSRIVIQFCIYMTFVWDERKARINRRKHGISFETAVRGFEDPRSISYADAVVDGEERWHTVGLAAGIAVLLVVHTFGKHDGEEEIRIISARKASRGERTTYDSYR